MNDECQKKTFDISAAEIISLAGSLALCFSKKYDKESLNNLRMFFQAVASNISIIEIKGFNDKK